MAQGKGGAEAKLSVLDLFLNPNGMQSALEESAPALAVRHLQASRTLAHSSLCAFEQAEASDALALPQMSVKDYWKSYASWLECWPSVRNNVGDQRDFARKWYHFQRGSGERSTYVVTALMQVAVLSKPDFKAEARNGRGLRPGQCVLVDKTVDDSEGTTFLKLVDNDGCVSETKPTGSQTPKATDRSDTATPVLSNVKLEAGEWWYRVACPEFVEVRRTPTTLDKARAGWVLCPGEIVMVMVRCELDGSMFMQLTDGRGWIFLQKPGQKGDAQDGEVVMAEIPKDGQGLPDELIPSWTSAGETIRPEAGEWHFVVCSPVAILLLGGKDLTGNVLGPGEAVVADRRCFAGCPSGTGALETWMADAVDEETRSLEKRLWVRLADGRGWTPVTDIDGTALLKEGPLQERPVALGGPYAAADADPDQEWRLGIC